MVVGLTGGIGSGKSTVAQLFAMKGWAVFNSDTTAKELYSDPHIKQEVIGLLGNEAYLSDGQVDRTYISSKIFNNAQLLAALNAIIHPAVGQRFLAFQNANKGKDLVKETALLFEAGIEKQVQHIVLVTAPDELRLARIMARDNITREIALKKMNSQIPQSEKSKRAHFEIHNDGEHSLIEQTLRVIEQLISKA